MELEFESFLQNIRSYSNNIFNVTTIGDKKLSFTLKIQNKDNESLVKKGPILSDGMIWIVWNEDEKMGQCNDARW